MACAHRVIYDQNNIFAYNFIIGNVSHMGRRKNITFLQTPTTNSFLISQASDAYNSPVTPVTTPNECSGVT